MAQWQNTPSACMKPHFQSLNIGGRGRGGRVEGGKEGRREGEREGMSRGRRRDGGRGMEEEGWGRGERILDIISFVGQNL